VPLGAVVECGVNGNNGCVLVKKVLYVRPKYLVLKAICNRQVGRLQNQCVSCHARLIRDNPVHTNIGNVTTVLLFPHMYTQSE